MPNEAGDDCVSQSKERCVFSSNGCGDAEIWREKVRGRVLEHIMTKLRSVSESNPGQIRLCCDGDTSVRDKRIASGPKL